MTERGKANMERMEEEVSDSDYRSYQHFISNSQWEHTEVIGQVAGDLSTALWEFRSYSDSDSGKVSDTFQPPILS